MTMQRALAAAPLVLCLAFVAGCGGTNWSSSATSPTTARVAAGAVKNTTRKPARTPASEPASKPPTTKKSTASTTPSTGSKSSPTTTATTVARSTPTTSPTGGSVSVSGVQSENPSSKGTTQWVVYNDASGVSLSHPRAWTIRAGTLGPVVVSVDGDRTDASGFRRTVNILEQPLADGLTSADYLRYTLAQISESGGIIEQDHATTLGGVAGRETIWHATQAGAVHRFMTVWAVRGHLAFLVTYSSDWKGFSTPLADVKRLVASIRLPPVA